MTFKDYCPSCQQLSEIEEVKHIEGCQAIGESDEAILKCRDCEYTWRV